MPDFTQRAPDDLGAGHLIGRKQPPVGWIAINNPLRRNAITLDMWASIVEVVAAFESAPDIRVIVVTGSGRHSFASGADISEFEGQRADPEAESRYSQATGLGHAALANCSKPTIAMIRGSCVGGGLALALDCDLRIASSLSRYGIPAAQLGLGYGFPGLAALTALVGPACAKELMFTAHRFEADEALRMGLLNRVVPDGELEVVTADYVRMIAANAPMTLKAAKIGIAAALKDESERDMAAVEQAISACFASEDYKEGRNAFLEKRKPAFKGR